MSARSSAKPKKRSHQIFCEEYVRGEPPWRAAQLAGYRKKALAKLDPAKLDRHERRMLGKAADRLLRREDVQAYIKELRAMEEAKEAVDQFGDEMGQVIGVVGRLMFNMVRGAIKAARTPPTQLKLGPGARVARSSKWKIAAIEPDSKGQERNRSTGN